METTFHSLSCSSSTSINPLRHPFHSLSIPRSVSLQRRTHRGRRRLSISSSLAQKPPSGDRNPIAFAAKPIALTLFCIAVGFAPFRAWQPRSIAAPVVADVLRADSKKKKKTSTTEDSKFKDHEFSDHTRRLLEKVSVLLKRAEDVKSGKVEFEAVEDALKEVKSRRRELQEEILGSVNKELNVLKGDRVALIKRSGEVVDAALKVERELESLEKKGEEAEKQRMERLESSMKAAEEEYYWIWEKVGEIDDWISRKETLMYSVAIRELSFIQRECELFVERLQLSLSQQKLAESTADYAHSRLSKSEIQKELEAAQKAYWEQMILPRVFEVDDPDLPLDPSTKKFVLNINQAFKHSRELQRNLEAQIRKKSKKFGDEKRFLVNTPADEVVKGFPEVKLKWMFGNKEVVAPKSVSYHLYHGWKKWREEAKASLKKNLLEDVECGRQYVAQRQERILLDRDRIMSKTWFNDEKNRWEMHPVAVPYAVSKKLIENARIRHDWGAMYVSLKGEEKEYYVNIKEFDILFEDFGGFDGLYMKMIASGIPTIVQLMWIPLSELDIRQQFLLVTRLSYQCIVGFWNSWLVSYARSWAFMKIRNTTDDIMIVIGFPIVEFIIPKPIRMRLGMAWPEELDQFVGSTWYLQWQSEAEINFKARKSDKIQWYFWFIIRSVIYGYVFFNVFRFMKRKLPRLLGFGPFRRNPNLKKLLRLKYFYRLKKAIKNRGRKAGFDPIKSAFDQMKRVKNPPIRLNDFASVDSMREEINEIVTFLQNPSAFKEIGARAPRGVLIVGGMGTGKTSLALAIAAEAKVPVVEVKPKQLEAGLWVGQSASNVRELFQTARELAPVIIFVEDFDLFAGVRGRFIHTKKQDHESFINQLLVELDGFEKQDGVVLIATTRNINEIDPALQRPGRMDRVLHLQQPTQTERERILLMAAKENMSSELIDFVDWEKVSEKMALMRPTELRHVPLALEGSAFNHKFLDTDELMSYCGWFASLSNNIPGWLRRTKPMRMISTWLVNHLGLALTRDDMQSVVDLMEPYGLISNGLELMSPPIDWTMETKFPHAVWAAGRGLIALLLPNFDVVDNIWLEPASWEGIGCTKITRAKEGISMNGNVDTRSYLEKKLVFCFGSYVASQLLLPLGEENYLSSNELRQAQEIATRMVLQYGWGPDDSPTIYFCSNTRKKSNMVNGHEVEMAAKVEKMYDLAYDKAVEMLQKNLAVLRVIVDQLLMFENMTGKELLEILEENGGIREQEPFFLSTQHRKELTSSRSIDNGNASGAAVLGTLL
ncbi:hypothetical protein QJS10_CPB17g01142 [Acorus calamus]|uniref:AAA+ ATPase domain-containing protein n=1 Tax=Acorus calamus TaxID=4465 RepID=A0AAV9CW05_ACOCL|nr:hypothetical protein QJS10_CPB17g01142 [Acorus calamus]